MKAEIYASTKKALNDLQKVFENPAFQPVLSRPVPVYPANVIRMALQDFHKQFADDIQKAVLFVENLMEQAEADESLMVFLQGKGKTRPPKVNTNYRMRETDEHKFLIEVSKASGIPMVDILSHITNLTIDRLIHECNANDWERFEKMNFGGPGNNPSPSGVRTGYRPKKEAVAPAGMSPEAKAIYEATNVFGGPFSGFGFGGKGKE